MLLGAQRSCSGTLFALQIYGRPLCLCVTVHPLEGGQVAATSGPGGPCQPHRVRQLTEERKKTGGRGWAVWRGDKGDREKERIWQKERATVRSCVRVGLSSIFWRSFNRRQCRPLTPTGMAKRLVSVQYNGQL